MRCNDFYISIDASHVSTTFRQRHKIKLFYVCFDLFRRIASIGMVFFFAYFKLFFTTNEVIVSNVKLIQNFIIIYTNHIGRRKYFMTETVEFILCIKLLQIIRCSFEQLSVFSFEN